jgi:predicted NACHT family NTPase
MTTGTEIALAVRVLAPLIKDLYTGAKGALATSFQKWGTPNFPKRLAKKIAAVESVKTLWQFEKEVSLREFYYPSSIISSKYDFFNNGDPVYKKIDSLADIEGSSVVVEGIVGQGKSIFLRYLCVQELSEVGSRRLPIFIEFRSFKTGQTVYDSIISELKGFGIDANDESFSYLANTGKLAILLDGFDELDAGLISGVINELEQLSNRFDDIKIIVTSRPDCDIQKSARFKVIRLAPLTQDDYLPFLTRLGLTRVRANEITHAIKESPGEVLELITTPLMLTLTVTVYRAEKSIPPLLPEFFEALFATVFTRHDKSKPGYVRKHKTELGERTLQKLFETFCFMAAQRELTRTLTAEEFATVFEKSLNYFSEAKCTVEAFKYDMCKVACLLLEEGLGDLTFLHKSIAEYFAASFVKRAQDGAAEKFYRSAANEFDRWHEILNFLSKIDQYRYYKYFQIPVNESFLESIGALNHELSVDALKKLIDKITKNMSLMLSRGEDRHVVGWAGASTGKLIESPVQRFIVSKIMRALMKNWPENPTAMNEYVNQIYSSENAAQIPCSKVIKYIGYDLILSDVKVALNTVHREIEEGKAFVDTENLKEDIF